MSKSRIVVTGTYINNYTYELRREDGGLFLKIRDGEVFYVANQEWLPISIPRNDGIGRIIVCRRIANNGKIMDQFYLFPNKKGLWALTARAADNGVFHSYTEPRDDLDRELMKQCIGPKIVKYVDTIDKVLECGGRIDKHNSKAFGYKIYTDGEIENLTEPELSCSEEHTIPADSTYQVRVYDATYLIYTQIWQRQSKKRVESIRLIMMTPEADREVVLRKLRKLSKGIVRR